MARHHRSTLLPYAAAAWGSVAVASFALRRLRRRRNKAREERIVRDGLPLLELNVVEALERHATTEGQRDKVALEGADRKAYTWKEYNDEVQAFGRALSGIGGEGGVAVHAFNSPRWFFSALGALSAGWTVSGIYLTNTYEQAKHIITTSDVRVLVLEGTGLLETTYKTVLKDFPNVTVVLLEGGDSDPKSRTPSYDAFVSKDVGAKTAQGVLEDKNVACLVYTSGTTGSPKAVELTLGNIRSVCAMMHARIPLSEDTVVVSYLPLSHIAAMGIDLFSPIYSGGTVHFADADALRGTLKDTLLRVRPTLFFGVPRVWEKMAAAMRAAAAKSYSKPITGPVLRTIGTAAKSVGGAWWSADTPELVRCFLTVPFGFFKVLALKKVRRGCGLDRCRLLYTGAAPLPADTINYLRSLDMPLLEVFGMSESSGAIAVCGPDDGARPLGACGRPLPIGELEIAPDGEILWRGDNNMSGYRGLPAATAAALSPKTAQLHTGDLGTIDQYGYLHITGRKKDIIITAGGENVAPTPIEETIGTLLHGVAGHVVLVGDRRKFLTILIAPAEDGPEPAAADVEAAIKEYNESYAKSRAQRVQKAHVLESPFTVATGELTPTMKVKRAFVVEKFTPYIEAMYADGASKLIGYSSMNIDVPELA